MPDKPNPFADIPTPMNPIIETLLTTLWSSGEWADEHEEMLGQWRDARGDAAKEAWTWWVGEDADEPYACDALSREDAIRRGHEMFSREGRFRIVEARMWADNVKEGDDEMGFAEVRNGESFSCTLPPIPRTARAVDLGGCNG
jgi:hypothetical protein